MLYESIAPPIVLGRLGESSGNRTHESRGKSPLRLPAATDPLKRSWELHHTAPSSGDTFGLMRPATNRLVPREGVEPSSSAYETDALTVVLTWDATEGRVYALLR